MKKIFLFFVAIVLLVFPSSILSGQESNVTVICKTGSLVGNPPFEEVPTYSYGSDGLVEFHFKVKPGGWWYTDFYYYHYSNECEYWGRTNTTYADSGWIRNVTNLKLKAVEVYKGTYNFDAYDEDTNERISVGNLPWNFSSPVIAISIGKYTAFDVVAATTPAVPVVKPGFNSGKTPVLIVPGVMGTDLKNDKELLWANTKMAVPFNSDEFMEPLSFNQNLTSSDPSVKVVDIIKTKPFFDYTEGLINEFSSVEVGYKENESLFTFPYDWRYGVGALNVEALKQKIEEIKAKTGSSNVDVIAHSTGGLLVKKYVMDNQSHGIRKAVFVGVPNTGAPKAVKVLVAGDNFNINGLNDEIMKSISKNMPVVYDLAPSRQYYNTKGSFVSVVERTLLAQTKKELDYDETRDFLLNDHGLNSLAWNNSQVLHTEDFDNFDMRSKGVDLYSISGCKTASIGNITETRRKWSGHTELFYEISYTPGDGTVPLESATNLPVDASKKYFALKADHAKMLSSNGIRQQIVKLVTEDPQIEVDSKLVGQDIGQCKLDGKAVSIFSPLTMEIVDNSGNKAGVAEDGSMQNDIPNAGFYTIGEHKFAFLPEEDGRFYSISLKGSGSGFFTLKYQDIADNEPRQAQLFIDIPVSPELSGRLEEKQGQAALVLDTDGNGTDDKIIYPSSVLEGGSLKDGMSPVSKVASVGLQGQAGYFRSEVALTLTAEDYLEQGRESEASGVLKTVYRLDGGDWQDYFSPILVEEEGAHALTYFSWDKAGNQEAPKTLEFVVDKTAPEAEMWFDQDKKDLSFKGYNNYDGPENIEVVEDGKSVFLKDRAGNKTELVFAEKSRKRFLKAGLENIIYNGVEAKLFQSALSFAWLYKHNSLTALAQHVRCDKDFNIAAVYDGSKTKVSGRDKTGKISESVAGLRLLKARTIRGRLTWQLN